MDEHFIRFELLFNISFDEANNAEDFDSPYYLIHCTGCESNIGAKPVTLSQKQVFESQNEADLYESQDGERSRSGTLQKTQVLWWVYKSALVKKEQKIKVALKSLKADEIRNFKVQMNNSLDAFYKLQDRMSSGTEGNGKPAIEFMEETLTKAKLRGYLSPASERPDVTILIHKCEGRMFLTDRNGFYSDLLLQQWLKTEGNVVIVLTCNRGAVPKDKLVNQDVSTMANQGDQPTLLLYEDKRRIFVWNKVPNELQQVVLAEKIIDGVYRQELNISKTDIVKFTLIDKKYGDIIPKQLPVKSKMPEAMKREFEAQNKELIDAITLMRNQNRAGRPVLSGQIRKPIGSDELLTPDQLGNTQLAQLLQRNGQAHMARTPSITGQQPNSWKCDIL